MREAVRTRMDDSILKSRVRVCSSPPSKARERQLPEASPKRARVLLGLRERPGFTRNRTLLVEQIPCADVEALGIHQRHRTRSTLHTARMPRIPQRPHLLRERRVRRRADGDQYRPVAS